MKNDVVISARDIGKRYTINKNVTRPETFRDALSQVFTRWKKPDASEEGGESRRREDLWALRGVSFDIHRQDSCAIIGLNGAGKSTLLKIISRVVVPTTGTVEINGNVASLIELGVGFHPDLSGRANVFLNGIMLGMRKQQVRERYDRIVEFSEIGRFMDVPVKHYSSGMRARLGFSVAAHLDTKILIVDEVLAVGDQYFQIKCLERLQELRDAGTTVLFVSHNLRTIATICERGMLFERGRLIAQGGIHQCIAEYNSRRSGGGGRGVGTGGSAGAGSGAKAVPQYQSTGQIQVDSLKITGGGDRAFSPENNKGTAVIGYRVLKKIPDLEFIIELVDSGGRAVLAYSTVNGGVDMRPHGAVGEHQASVALDFSDVASGIYTLALSVYRAGKAALLIRDPDVPLAVEGNDYPIHRYSETEHSGVVPRTWKWGFDS